MYNDKLSPSAGLGMGALTSTPVSPKQSQIVEELSILKLTTESLNGTFGQLVNKLTPIMRSEPINDKVNGNRTDKMIVGLAQEIRGERFRLEELNMAVKGVINSIEL
jgi:hypothetical protein